MPRITPTQTFRNGLRRPALNAKLPTAFRVPYSVSVDASLRDLLVKLHQDHGVNCSKEIEPLIKRWAAKRARKINERRS